MIKTKVIMQDAEVRGVEKKTSKKGTTYLIVRVDDEAGNRSELLDRDVDRASFYFKGTIMDFVLSISIGKYSSVEIVEATNKH